jgi:hypothetical protein
MTSFRLLCSVLCLGLLATKHSFAISPLNDVLLAAGYDTDEIQEIRDGKVRRMNI